MGALSSRRETGSPVAICNAIRKKLFITDKTVREFFEHNAMGSGSYTRQDFINIMNYNL